MIAAPHGLTVTCRADLCEVDVGRWENRSWGEIETSEPEAYRLFFEDAGTNGYGGGENLSQVLDRVRPAFEEILTQNIGRCVAVVGHNVVNRTWLARALLIWYGEHFPSGGLTPGLHNYHSFIKPKELQALLTANRLQVRELTSAM